LNEPTLIRGDLRGLRIPALIVGVIGAVVLVLAFFFSQHRHEAFAGYLIAYVLCFGVAAGSLGFLLIHQLSGGRWGEIARPAFAAGVLTLPLLALLFVPIVAGMSTLYPWMVEAYQLAHWTHLRHKIQDTRYLTFVPFLVRAAAYFIILILIGFLLVSLLKWQDRRPDPVRGSRLGGLGGVGLVVLFFVLTFAMVDWLMSIDPVWYSTMFPLQMIAGMGLTAMAVTILIILGLGRRQRTEHRLGRAPEPAWYTRDAVHDFGKLLFMLVCLYAYLSFSQYVIIWSGNLPEETHWYQARNTTRWAWAPPLLIAIHFAIPFVVLMSRHVKRNTTVLAIVAILILAARVIDLCWIVLPSYEVEWRGKGGVTLQTGWAAIYAVAALAAIGGLQMALYAWSFKPTPPPVEAHAHDHGSPTEVAR
jgi:hypothetical protein